MISGWNCQFCNIKFSDDTDLLVVHSKSCLQAPRLDRSYMLVCLFCEYHCSHSGHMRDHIRKHTGDKPFACSLCNYNSTTKSNVKIHMKIKHDAVLQKDVNFQTNPTQ